MTAGTASGAAVAWAEPDLVAAVQVVEEARVVGDEPDRVPVRLVPDDDQVAVDGEQVGRGHAGTLRDQGLANSERSASRHPARRRLRAGADQPKEPRMTVLPRFDVADQVALVTGAARGLGRAIALALAAAGADVALGLRDLGSNAGVAPENPAEDVVEEDFDRTLAVNLKGTFFTSQAAARVMIPQGYGRIVNMSSQAGFIALPGESVYCMTKAAIAHLTKCLAVEWGPHNITVNAVAPTFIATPGTEPALADPQFRADVLERVAALHRVGEPVEVAGVVVFLASPAASLITGETVLIARVVGPGELDPTRRHRGGHEVGRRTGVPGRTPYRPCRDRPAVDLARPRPRLVGLRGVLVDRAGRQGHVDRRGGRPEVRADAVVERGARHQVRVRVGHL